jgi:diaminopimelate dehydrogenase
VLHAGGGDTFWDNEVSQGHSDAVRRIKGVKRAVQYTVPKPVTVEKAGNGENSKLSARDKHMRICYVAAEK